MVGYSSVRGYLNNSIVIIQIGPCLPKTRIQLRTRISENFILQGIGIFEPMPLPFDFPFHSTRGHNSPRHLIGSSMAPTKSQLYISNVFMELNILILNLTSSSTESKLYKANPNVAEITG